MRPLPIQMKVLQIKLIKDKVIQITAVIVLKAMPAMVSFFVVTTILLLPFNHHLNACHTKPQYNADTIPQA